VAQTIKNASGQVKVILMTGWASHLAEAEADEHSVDLILRKPFDFDDVLDAMASLSVTE
jgi:ActR/RegA family two-component response regulator